MRFLSSLDAIVIWGYRKACQIPVPDKPLQSAVVQVLCPCDEEALGLNKSTWKATLQRTGIKEKFIWNHEKASVREHHLDFSDSCYPDVSSMILWNKSCLEEEAMCKAKHQAT